MTKIHFGLNVSERVENIEGKGENNAFKSTLFQALFKSEYFIERVSNIVGEKG